MTAKPPALFPNALSLTVASVPRSIEFYKQKLGFKLAECFLDKKRPCWANMVHDGQSLMLGELPSLAEARQLGMGTEEIDLVKQDARAFARGAIGVGAAYYVLVADVDALARRLKKKRVKLLTPPKDQFYGIRELRVADPDGYRLVFYQPVAHACDGTCEHGTPADGGGKSDA